MHKLIWLLFAGALGTLARYGLTGFVHRISGAYFPWATLFVNILACFLAGFLWVLFENRLAVTGEFRVIIFVGFIGAFSTFSTFILETSEFALSSEWVYAGANILMQNFFGFAAFLSGAAFGRLI